MSDNYAGLPKRIFGIRCSQHRTRRAKEFLTYNKVAFRQKALKATLLQALVGLERNYTPLEQKAISLWFRGSEGTAALEKVKALPSHPPHTGPLIVPKTKDGSSNLEIGPPQAVKGLPAVECSVCMDTSPHSNFPEEKLAPSCAHELTVCLTCLSQSLQHQIEEMPWDQVACPECPKKLSFETVKKFATPESFQRYDKKSILAVFRTLPNFTMCLGPRCDSGQVHAGGNDQPIMTCTECHFKTCFTHKLPWHTDETCAQYDAHQEEKRKQEEASEKLLARSTKVCPNPMCGLHVDKYTGCDHIYCTACRYEFCWVCLASYAAIRRKGNTAHLRSCKYHTDRLNGILGH